MDPPSSVDFREPATADEWQRYFELRWRVLRAPWGQPPGSEKDDLEPVATHVAAWSPDGDLIAVGRIHMNSETEAQVRYMAVDAAHARRGCGSRILAELESRAAEKGATAVVLNARDTAQPFYESRGYHVVGPAETLFEAVRHVRMEKNIAQES